MSDYSKWSIDRLKGNIDILTNKLWEFKLDESPNQSKIQTVTDELDLLDQALKEKTETGQASPSIEATSGQSSAVSGYSGIHKELQNAFRDVNSFESGCDVHIFINRLEVYYSLYVSDNKSEQMEKMFVRLATAKMSTDYATQMQNYRPVINTFEGMKIYLKHHHASKMSSYQYLDTCWELEKQEAESLRDYARRISDKMSEARSTIEAKFEAYKKSNNDAIENSAMSTKDVFDMVSGQIFLQWLKSHGPRIFNQIVSDLDEVWNATDIANLAMAYQERMATEDDPILNKPGTSLTIEKKPKNKGSKNKSICYRFLNDKCPFGDKCFRSHDKNILKIIDKKSSKTIEKKSDSNGSKASSGGGAKESFVAASLPTQDFCQ